MFSRKKNEVPAVTIPRIDDVRPAAALPGGEVELLGACLGPDASAPPVVLVAGHAARVAMSREAKLVFRTPQQAETGMVEVRSAKGISNQVPLRVAKQLSDGLHPVTNPAVSRSGMIYATISGQRGKPTPVSVVRVSPGGHGTPFVSGILNATGLAIAPDDTLYVTSRAEGNVYRVDAGGDYSLFVEGMGVATGAAFDAEGNLYVGDRSGTLFKIAPDKQIFVHATLEPSVSAYHLAADRDGALFVTAPALGSSEAIWKVEPNGDVRAWYRGLGRPQGLALAADGSIFVTANLHGQRGLVRITEGREASLAVSGSNLVGVAFSPLGTTILATHDAVFEVDLGVEGLILS
jgi:sugar lactone lactonase YvrE